MNGLLEDVNVNKGGSFFTSSHQRSPATDNRLHRRDLPDSQHTASSRRQTFVFPISVYRSLQRLLGRDLALWSNQPNFTAWSLAVGHAGVQYLSSLNFAQDKHCCSASSRVFHMKKEIPHVAPRIENTPPAPPKLRCLIRFLGSLLF
jgi:hypothetical protein